MSLEDKLTKVDEAIWKQFEKITVKANKELGWNKYDLARKSLSVAGTFFLGAGVYLGIAGYLERDYFSTTLGVLISLYAPLHIKSAKKELEELEDREISLLEKTGSSIQPIFRAYRPVLISSAASTYSSIGLLDYLNNQFQAMSPDTLTSSELHLFAAGTYVLAVTASEYFKSQIMTPPTKKKKFFKTLYDKVTEPLKPRLEPTSEPVNSQQQTL